MRPNLTRYFLGFVNEIQIREQITLDISRLLEILYSPGQQACHYIHKDPCPSGYTYNSIPSPICYKITMENFGSFAYLSVTLLDEYIHFGNAWSHFGNRRYPIENHSLYYIKVIPETDFIYFEKEGKIIANRNTTGKTFEKRVFLNRVSIRKDAPRLTFQSSKRKVRLYSRYFSFKNLNLLRKVLSPNMLSVCFPKSNEEFVSNLLHTQFNWNVSMKEFREIHDYKSFLQVHISNSQSTTRVTKTLLTYPVNLVFQLTQIKDKYTSAVLEQSLSKRKFHELCIDQQFRPHFIHYFFLLCDTCGINPSDLTIYISDYLSSCKQLELNPNVRLKSFKRLKAEHDRLAFIIRDKEIEPFIAPEPVIKQVEVDGFKLSHISNHTELIAESVDMKHCVAGYATSVKSGASVVYSIDGPERATLEICQSHYTGGFNIRQCKGRFNQQISPTLQKAIDKFFDDYYSTESSSGAQISNGQPTHEDMPF